MNPSVLIAAVAAFFPALALAQAAAGVAPPQQGAFGASSAAQMFVGFDRRDADLPRARVGDDGRTIPARNASFLDTASDTGINFFTVAPTGLTPLAANGDGKFNAPYYAMVQDARRAGLNMALGENSRLRLGLLYEGATSSDVLPTLSPYARRTLVSAELEQRMGRTVAVLSMGVLRESGSLLGSLQGSALALNTAARTSFASVSLGYALAPQLSLVGMASAGHTAGYRSGDSAVTQVASVGTVAYSVGLAARKLFDSRDRFGLTLTVPTKVTDGAQSLAGALVQHEDGALSYVNRTLNLAPSATERDLEMTYSRPLNDLAKLSGALMLRVHPGHDASSPRDLLMGLRYGRKF